MYADNSLMNERLIHAYQRWYTELASKASCLTNEKYSNPYYISIPDGWCSALKPRIMVVGEEGFGSWGCGKGDRTISADEIGKIQERNYSYLRKQLYGDGSSKLNSSPFWRRFRRVSEFGVCCWTNIDKIHILDDKSCALKPADRKRLHSTNVRILQEEIDILQPDVIVFFGWYGVSLQHECPEVFKELYPAGPGDKSRWDRDVVPIVFDGKHYIFAYHPNWGYRQADYEDKVLSMLEKSLGELKFFKK